MSQSRFSIVLVGVSALLRRPLVSRLRPADGERSPWMVFTARVGRFDSGGRWAGWPSGSLLPLFGMHRFGDCRSASWPSGSLLPLFGMHRFGNCPRRVGLRAHGFRFSTRTASEIALGGLVLPPSASEIAARRVDLRAPVSVFRHAPIRGCRSAGWCFRWAGWPSGSPLPLFGMHRFGVAAGRVRSSAFRFGNCPRRVGLRAHCFRFSACADPHRCTAEARTD